ncbi:hypothetical protein ACLB2K_047167 [Fragaria x ananassa]
MASSTSPVKRSKSKMNNGKKEGLHAGKGVKGDFAVKKVVVAEISPKMSEEPRACSELFLRYWSGFDPSLEMNALSWNCQGIGNPWTVNGLKGLLTLIHPDIVFLCETRCLKNEMESIRRQTGFKIVFAVDCVIRRNDEGRVCRAGGLCVLWQEGVKLSLISYSLNHIDMVIEGVGPCSWRFIGVYRFSKVEERYRTWELIRSLAQGGSGPWLLGGDLDEILRSSEKEGGPPRDFEQMEAFRKCLEDCGLIDLNFSGLVFTWKGKRARELVKTTLDCFVANKEWKEVFSASRVTHMKPSKSDHVPLGIEISATRIIRRVKRK